MVLFLNIEDTIKNNKSLVYYTVNKYFSSWKDDEDILQAGMIGLWKACLNFDKDKGYKFSTLAVKCIYRNILIELRDRKRSIPLNCISLDTSSEEEEDYRTPINSLVDHEDLFSLLELKELITSLSEEEKYLIRLRYEGFTYEEIGKELGVSKSMIGVWMKRLRKKLESN